MLLNFWAKHFQSWCTQNTLYLKVHFRPKNRIFYILTNMRAKIQSFKISWVFGGKMEFWNSVHMQALLLSDSAALYFLWKWQHCSARLCPMGCKSGCFIFHHGKPVVGYEYGYESGAAVYQIDLLLSGIPLRNTCIIRRIICIVDVSVTCSTNLLSMVGRRHVTNMSSFLLSIGWPEFF